MLQNASEARIPKEKAKENPFAFNVPLKKECKSNIFFVLVDASIESSSDPFEAKLFEKLSLEEWPSKLFGLIAGRNTEGFSTFFTPLETCN